MAIIGKIRERSTLVLILIGGAIVAFVLSDLFGSGASVFNQTRNVAVVDGVNISAQEFQNRVDIATENYQANQPEEQIDDNTRDNIRQQVYDQMINEIVVGREMEELGVDVTTKELFDMVQGNNPHPQVRQAFSDPETGQFNPTNVVRFLQNLDERPEVKDQWIQFEKALKLDRESQKYNTLISKGLYVTSSRAKEKNKSANRNMTIKYVMKRYNEISDTTISLTDSELKDYYNEHKDDYFQEPSRKIEYVMFNILPSEKDEALVRKWANDMYQEFKATKNDSLFVANNSDEGFDPKYYSSKNLPDGIDTNLFAAEKGFVTMPYQIGNETNIQKLVDKKVGPDSVKAQHIVITTQNKSKERAIAIVDSLMAEINKGLSFDTLAMNNSEDLETGKKGGDIGWFIEGMANKPIDKALFNSNVGEVKKVETSYGYHIIKINEKTADVTKIKVAALKRAPEPGKETYSTIFQQANGFSINSGSDKWDDVINNGNLSRRQAILSPDDREIRGMENSKNLANWINEAEVGDVSEPFDVKDAYVVAKLVEVNDKGPAPFEKVRARVEYEAKRDKKAEKFIELMSGSQNLAEAAKKANAQIMDAANVTFDNANITGAGNEPEVVAKVYTLQQGQMTAKPLKGQNGVFMVQLVNVTEPAETEVTTIKNSMQSAYSSRVSSRQAIDALKEKAKIKDNRAKFF